MLKKMFLTAFIITVTISKTFAITVSFSEDPIASKIMVPIGDTKISFADYLQLSPNQYKILTGKKLGLLGTLKFKIAQHRLKRLVTANGTIDSNKVKGIFDGSDFHKGGYALGLFLGPIGVIIAYLIKDDLKHDRVKWAWWGFVGFLGLVLALANAGVISFY